MRAFSLHVDFKRSVLGLSRGRGHIKENHCLFIRAASLEGVVEPNKSFLLRIRVWSPKLQCEISCMALVDTGASAQLFIDISFAHSHGLLTQKLQQPRSYNWQMDPLHPLELFMKRPF